MAEAYIYNGFGQYETRQLADGTLEKGMTVNYAGLEWWFPFEKVTTLPDRYTFRELDHDKSTPEAGTAAELTYTLVLQKGDYIADQMVNFGLPVPPRQKGILIIKGKKTGNMIDVPSGYDIEGKPSTTRVEEVEATKAEKDTAARLAKRYKEGVVKEYLQSKRERMTSGKGRAFPDPRTQAYMDELEIVDTEDILAHQKPQSGLTPELLSMLIEAVGTNKEEVLEAIKKSSPTAKNGKRSLGLAEHKAKYDAAQAEEVVK